MRTNKFGVKLTGEQVRFVQLNWKLQKRRFWKELAEKWGVLPITLRRIGEGKTWRESYVDKRKENSKACLECGSFFFQRVDGKPRKSDARFARQRYCTFACATKAKWKRGVYAESDFLGKRRKARSECKVDVGASPHDSDMQRSSAVQQCGACEGVRSERKMHRPHREFSELEGRANKDEGGPSEAV